MSSSHLVDYKIGAKSTINRTTSSLGFVETGLSRQRMEILFEPSLPTSRPKNVAHSEPGSFDGARAQHDVAHSQTSREFLPDKRFHFHGRKPLTKYEIWFARMPTAWVVQQNTFSFRSLRLLHPLLEHKEGSRSTTAGKSLP